MNIVSVVGNVDKRIVALPLARALAIVGKTAVITNETEYRRLSVENKDIIKCGQIEIMITQELQENSIERIEKETFETYSNIVYISNTYIHPESKAICLCRGIEKSFLPNELSEQIKKETEQYPEKVKELVISANSTKDKNDTRYVVGLNEFKWICNVEETKDLVPFNSKVLNSFIASVGAMTAGLQEKNFEEILTRDSLVTAKKK